MKFAFVTGMLGSPWGGSEDLWSQTAVRLRRLGHEVAASVPFWPKLSPRVAAMAEMGINLNVHFSRQSPKTVKALSRGLRIFGVKGREFEWLQMQKPDLVIVSQGAIMDGLDWLEFCQKAALPFSIICQCNAETWWPGDAVAAEMAKAYLGARKVFFVSQSNLELFERQIGKSLPNAAVARNPCKVSMNKPVPWPSEDGTWRMASVARLDPVAKGQDLLFHFLARPAWRKRAVELNLYGTGPCAQGMRRLAEHLQLKAVHFHGFIEDVSVIWEQNHLHLLPSRIEGLPLSLVEAMWCGRPSVVTDIAGNTEVCDHGKTGFVAAAPAPEIFAQTMEEAWNRRGEWRKMGQAARLRAEQILPKDPVGQFSQQLISCAKN